MEVGGGLEVELEVVVVEEAVVVVGVEEEGRGFEDDNV